MKLNKFRCENYKSIKNAELDFNKLNHFILIGENGCGKTHNLEVFDWFFNGFDINDNSLFENCIDTGKQLTITINSNVSKTNAKGLLSHDSYGVFKFNKDNELRVLCYKEKRRANYICKVFLNNVPIENEDRSLVIDVFRSGYQVIYIPILMHNSEDFNKTLEKLIINSAEDKIDTNSIDDLLVDKTGDKYSITHETRHEFKVVVRKGGKLRPIENLNSGAKKELFESLIMKLKKETKEKIIMLYDEFELHYHPNKILKF